MRIKLTQPSSQSTAAKSAGRAKASWLRGIVCALPAGIAGFSVPYAAYLASLAVWYYLFNYSSIDVMTDIRGMPRTYFEPGIGCSIVFALAAILNYVPAKRIGFIRALMFVGLVTLAQLFVLAILFLIFNLGAEQHTIGYQLRTSDHRVWLRIVLVLGCIPFVYTVIHTYLLISTDVSKDIESNSSQSQEFTE
jgi:hypothetical protein